MAKKTQESTNDPLNQSSGGRATSMAELMRSQSSKVLPLQRGKLVTGTVKKLTPKEILLDIGAKSDALVIEYDKTNLANLLKLLKVGDTVQASVISPESEEGFPVVSLRRMLDDLIFKGLEKSQGAKEIIRVKVLENGPRGGYFVETPQLLRGFLPNSQLLNQDEVGDQIDVCIIESDRAKKRIIFSQKATVYTIDPKTIEKYIKKDSVVEAEVISVSPHGVYVAIKPASDVLIEGFVHISEIAHEKILDIQQRFKKGDEIKAQILEFDGENRRVNLSIKKLEKDTFEETKSTYKKEQKVKGKVLEIKSKGITVEIGPGIQGFIQASKIPTGITFNVGDAIEAEVSGIDERKRVILLTPIMTTKFVGYR